MDVLAPPFQTVGTGGIATRMESLRGMAAVIAPIPRPDRDGRRRGIVGRGSGTPSRALLLPPCPCPVPPFRGPGRTAPV